MATQFTPDFFSAFSKSGTLISKSNGKLIIGWGTQQWSSKPSPNQLSLYFPDFFLNSPTPWLIPSHWTETSAEELLIHWPPNTRSFDSINWQNPYKAQFQSAFCNLKSLFQNGSLQKAVPYVFEIADHPFAEQLDKTIYHLLQTSQFSPLHLYGFWSGNSGMLGATPELLFKNSSDLNTLETVACAGTSEWNDLNFAADPKQMYEHRLVVEGITQSLSPFCEVVKGEQTVLKLKTIAHLVTPFRATLKQPKSFEEILRALHPTPALGAFPKETGWNWLRDYQQLIPRDRYGAPVGYISGSEFCCYVAIRNLQWDNFKMKIGAGCGIVNDSKFNEEWQEIQLKIQSIKDILALT